jgi:hypothetical protein
MQFSNLLMKAMVVIESLPGSLKNSEIFECSYLSETIVFLMICQARFAVALSCTMFCWFGGTIGWPLMEVEGTTFPLPLFGSAMLKLVLLSS